MEGLEYEYWLVCALGKSATKLKPTYFPEKIIEFYEGRLIKRVKGNYTEQQILEIYYNQ